MTFCLANTIFLRPNFSGLTRDQTLTFKLKRFERPSFKIRKDLIPVVDIKFVNGSTFEAIDCNDKTISIYKLIISSKKC